MKKYLSLILIFIVWGCRPQQNNFWYISGPAMGTVYNITCGNGDQDALKVSIEKLLDDFNLSLSTYLPESNISKFNNSDSIFWIPLQNDPYFLPVLERSKKLYIETNQAFDPSILPLLEYYGFGSRKAHDGENPNINLDSIMNLVGFDKIRWEIREDTLFLRKQLSGIKLNFNSIAKGYGVDLVAKLLDKNGVDNYLVEIGGEVRTKGVSPRSSKWRLGINTPSPDATIQEYLLTVDLSDAALATSGNYRDFYTKNGKKYVHIIDPRSGENKESSLASATIIAEDCATADALATACIVLGLKESVAMVNKIKGAEACFIELKEDQFELHFTEKFNQYLNE